jgi:putative ABC transport system permease protein
MTMLSNYFKVALRNLLRNRTYAIINISGIAVGMTAFALFALYVADELSFDRFHEKADRIVRVVHHAEWDGGEAHHAVTSAAFAPALKASYPEVDQAVRIVPEGGGIIHFENKVVSAGGIFFTDNSVFDVFTFPFLYGNSKTSLTQPESIVLTETLAIKLFGDAKGALNQTVYFEGKLPNKVTGVIKDVPGNSHLRFEALRSLPAGFTDRWSNSNQYTYLLLAEGTDPKAFEAKLPAFAAQTIEKELEFDSYHIELQPLTSIHLHSSLDFEISANNSINRIYLFVLLATLTLVIAIINYMNLSTARAFLRIKEVGIRKVVGSARRNLAGMFIMDALVISIVAALLAFVLISSLLPVFNLLADKELDLWNFGLWQPVLALAVFAVMIGVISGSYPAWFLSRFKTTAALKGQLGDLSNSALLRESLVVFQFVVTIGMISGSAIIYRQMQFVSQKDLGFNKDQVLTFHIDDMDVRNRIAPLKAQLLRNPAIESVATAGNPIGNNDLGQRDFYFQGFDGVISKNATIVQELVVDADYIPTMEIEMLQGRNFSMDHPADKDESVLINEKLKNELGWENAIGKQVEYSIDGETRLKKKVIGVIRDFHTYSLQYEVQAMVLNLPARPSMEDNLYIRVSPGGTQAALDHIEKTYREFDKASPLQFNFLDQNFDRQYAREEKQEQLSLVFTILAVFIACLGLFGLAAFTSQQRVKEIGIRKVLGATVSNIVSLLARSYVKLVLIASIIAFPLASWAMDRWLEEFAYHVNASAWVYASSGLMALMIALLTVSGQAFMAAVANPVESLRSE